MKSFRSLARRSEPAPDNLVRLFQSETAEILETPEPAGVRATVYVLTGFIVSLIVLAAFVRLDRVVYSSGQIVTTQATMVVQALDPSIIKSLNTQEGERVKGGQLLATLDPTFAAADVEAATLQIESVDHFAVVAERLGPRRLLVGRHERQTADLQQLGRREEHHLRREVVNRIDERALLDDLIVEAALPGRNRCRQAARARAYDDEIARRHN